MAEVTKKVLSDILHGKLENLPKPKTNVVRVFLSSTFTGERNERKKWRRKREREREREIEGERVGDRERGREREGGR